MNDPLQPQRCARLLRALGAPERLAIIRLLSEQPRTVSALAAALALPLVNLSHHLTVLRQAGFVHDHRQGRFVVYSLAPGFLDAGAEGPHLNLGCCRLELPQQSASDSHA